MMHVLDRVCVLFWVTLVSFAVDGVFCVLSKCDEVCPRPASIVVPTCNGTRIEPHYHEACDCLLAYNCCPHECPKTNKTCATGVEIPVRLDDCCKCPATRCDSCPKLKDPQCVPGCQELETLADIINGCHFNACKVVCPQLDQVSCPKCQIPEAFTNASLCSCTQQRCVAKPCPPKKQLASKDCALRKWAKTECGCDKQFYDEEHYCDDHNAAAAAYVCKDKCFKTDVLKGKSACGCDKPQCVRIDEECLQTFKGWDCPTGTVKQSGMTPCGLKRDICIKCDIVKLSDESCDRECNEVVQSKDVNGCPIEKCKKKPCPHQLQQTYSFLEDSTIFKDECGCVSYLSSNTDAAGKTWIIVQKRQPVHDDDIFTTGNWSQFRHGFGAISDSGQSKYWLGLSQMHELTKDGNWEVMFRVKWASGSKARFWGYSIYTGFKIGSEENEFRLHYGRETKNSNTIARNPLGKLSLDGQPFRTVDRNRHACTDNGAWWSNPTAGSCQYLCLNCKNAATGSGGHTIWHDNGCKKVSETIMAISKQ